jgi:hypothetical protein
VRERQAGRLQLSARTERHQQERVRIDVQEVRGPAGRDRRLPGRRMRPGQLQRVEPRLWKRMRIDRSAVPGRKLPQRTKGVPRHEQLQAQQPVLRVLRPVHVRQQRRVHPDLRQRRASVRKSMLRIGRDVQRRGVRSDMRGREPTLLWRLDVRRVARVHLDQPGHRSPRVQTLRRRWRTVLFENISRLQWFTGLCADGVRPILLTLWRQGERVLPASGGALPGRATVRHPVGPSVLPLIAGAAEGRPLIVGRRWQRR